MYLVELFNKHVNIILRDTNYKIVTGIKILHVVGGWVTLLLSVVPSDTDGGADELDTLSIGKMLLSFRKLAASILSVVQEH